MHRRRKRGERVLATAVVVQHERAGLAEVARVLFRRSLITEQSARELGAPPRAEARRNEGAMPSIYFALTAVCPDPIVSARLLTATSLRGWIPREGVFKGTFLTPVYLARDLVVV